MNRDEWTRIKAIVADALALPESERAHLVAARCGADQALLREALSLIESAAIAANLYESPSFAHADVLAILEEGDALRDPTVGGRIGAYNVLSQIGRGGMGTAYLAVRADDTYEKRVAIKLIKLGMDSDAILQKFRRERQILANLEHPNIVMLLDGGTTSDGRPYFVMEFVDGQPIDTYVEEHELSLPERLRLFLSICAAVEHAHEQRVLHRDLKPGNILVTKNGTPKLLDFGIAKLLTSDDNAYTREATLFAQAMTPRYASPEQIRGELLTPLSDVYSLGVLLYELIAGRSPYDLDGRTVREVERIVCEVRPTVPSKVRRDSAAGSQEIRFGPKRSSTPELDSIALTALEKEPSRRYESARALGDDIKRYLDGLPVAARPPRLRLSRSRLQLASVAGVLIAVVAAGLFIGARLTGRDVAPAGPQSIAVLPFVNVGGDPGVEYISEGLTEDIINRLSRIPHLKVIARDSAFRYEGTGGNPERIGRDLGVRSILTGRVVQRGSTLAVSAELVDTRNRRQIWGERYERPASDVQALQAEVAGHIASSLQLRFSGNERAELSRPYTRHAGAYEAYLKGRYFWNKRTPAAMTTSIEYFNRAVAMDPQFALAYAGLADAYGLLTEYHALPALTTYPEAKKAALKALEIDPELAEARISLAYIRQFYEWNFEAAEREYRRVLAANPSYSTGHQWYAEYLSAMGRHEEALEEIGKALAVDPLSLIVNSVESNILYTAGEYDRAIQKAGEVVAMDANFPEVYEYLKRSYDQKRLYRQAIAARQARRQLLGRDARVSPALAEAAATTNPQIYWQKRLEQELAESQAEGVYPFELAEINAQLGDKERALEMLERACGDHDFMMVSARTAPNLATLRHEPRFLAILQRGCAVPLIP